MLLRQTLLYLPAQLLGPLFQLASAFVWTHFLVPSDMGVFALVSAAQELAFATAMNWFALYTVRYFDGTASRDQRTRFHASESAVMCAASLAMIVVLCVMPIGPNGRLTGAMLSAAIAYVVSRSLVSYMAERARVQGDTLAYTALQTFTPVAGLVLGLILVLILPATAAAVLTGYTIAQAISLVFAAFRLEFSTRPQDADPAILRNAMTFGLPLIVGALFVWVANNGLRFLIDWRYGMEGVGLVTVGWALGLRASQFASMLTTAAAFPLAVRRAREDGIHAGQAQLIKNGVLLVATLAPAIVGLIVIGKPLIALVVAAPYRDMTNAVLPFALVTGAARAVRLHFATQVYLLREVPAQTVIFDMTDAALTIVLGVLGLWMGGMIGCVEGVCWAAIAALVFTLATAHHAHAFTFPVSDLLRIGTATGAMAIAVSRFGPTATALSLIAAIVVGGIVYAAAMALLYPTQARDTAILLQGAAHRLSKTALAKTALKRADIGPTAAGGPAKNESDQKS